MADANINQLSVASGLLPTDKMYLGRSPFGATDDRAILVSSIFPSSATDNAIARYDGTSGTKVQSSSVTIGDTGIFDGITGLGVSGTQTWSFTASSSTTVFPIYGAAGSVGAPEYSFSGDTNTGMYSAAADTINWAVGGALGLTLSTTALTLGSGISLAITGLTAGSVLFAGSSANINQDNAQLFWDDSNNALGIGTNTPTSGIPSKVRLTSAGSSLRTALHLNGSIAGTSSGSPRGIHVETTIAPNVGGTCMAIDCDPVFAAAAATQLTGICYQASPAFAGNAGQIFGYGFFYDGGGPLVGTIPLNYGAFFHDPAAGSIKMALWSANFMVGSGYSLITPPTDGGCIKGRLYLGTSSGVGTSDAFQMVGTHAIGETAATTTGLLRLAATGSATYIQSGLQGSAGSSAPLIFTNIFAANEWMRLTATGRLGLGTASPQNIFDVAAGMVIGSGYAGTNTAPPNGLLVQGQTIFKATTAFVNASVEIQGSDRVTFGIGGTKTATDGSTQVSFFINPTYAPVSNTAICANIISYPQFNPPTGVTITTAYNHFLQSGGQGGLGSVTTGINLYVQNPGFGTTKYAGYFNGNLLATAFQIPTGAVDGYVLHCNASGVASWAPAGSGGSGLLKLAITSVKTSAYTVTTSDCVVQVDTSGGVVTITLPLTSTAGQVWYITDVGGSAGINNIIIDVQVPGTINALLSYNMTTSYGTAMVTSRGNIAGTNTYVASQTK